MIHFKTLQIALGLYVNVAELRFGRLHSILVNTGVQNDTRVYGTGSLYRANYILRES